MLYYNYRLRFAWRTRVNCADMFLCCGQFGKAALLYQTALEALEQRQPVHQPVPSESVQRPIARSVSAPDFSAQIHAGFAALHSKETSRNTSEAVTALGNWSDLKFWILRKLQLCARARNDLTAYVEAGLALLTPELNKSCSILSSNPTLRQELFEDVVRLIKKNDEENDTATILHELKDNYRDKQPLESSLRPLIEAHVTLLPTVDCPKKLSTANKIIQDEHFQVLSYFFYRRITLIHIIYTGSYLAIVWRRN